MVAGRSQNENYPRGKCFWTISFTRKWAVLKYVLINFVQDLVKTLEIKQPYEDPSKAKT